MSALPLYLILAITTALAAVFYIRQRHLQQVLKSSHDKLLEEIRQKESDILHQSITKAQEILANAELEGVKALSNTKLITTKLEQEYNAKLSELIKQAQDSIATSQAQLIQFLNDQQRVGVASEAAGQKQLEIRINQLFDKLESRLSSFLMQTEQKTTYSIELELKSARQLIETYKQQQFALIDENILAMMEQTLGLVLNKKLSLKEQLDLVYEALEKAKVEKFIV
ncbi:hypothetical protein HYT18_02415 [Candidatus Microgenomates bacterium]|nr:hypothetical protein [Candidatus Microgenomates bacterium]